MDLLGNIANLKVDTVLSAVDKYVPGAQNKIKNLADKAKAYVNNVSELELKVLEATNHDPWGPHGSVMQEITNSCFSSEGFHQIMGVLDQRLSEPPENWRLVYKALLLLEFMVKHGPLSVADAVVSYSRLSQLQRLAERFEFKEASGRDQGINVRQRAGALLGLVQDRERLNEERDKAAKNKSKYTGVSSSAARYGGYGPGGGASSSSAGYGAASFSSGSAAAYGGGGGDSSSSSSSYQRSTSASAYGGSGGGGFEGGSSGGAAGAAAAAGDPVEATRQRIARLKAEGALPEGGGEGAGAAGAGGSSVGGTPGLGSPRKPKKLSDIRVNPAISATFAKAGGGGGGVLGAPPGHAAAAAPAASGIDLLGDLADDPPPPAAAAGAAAAPAAAGPSRSGLDDWDGFASAPAAGAGAGAGAAAKAVAGGGGDDEWAAFDSAPPPAAGRSSSAAPHKQPLDINALLGPLPTTSAASTTAAGSGLGGGSKAPLPLDDFCSAPLHAAPPAPAAAAGAHPRPQQPAGFDPFGAPAQPPAAATAAAAGGGGGAPAGDPFAASGAVHMAPPLAKQPPPGAPKLGPDTAKAKDPFADLAFV